MVMYLPASHSFMWSVNFSNPVLAPGLILRNSEQSMGVSVSATKTLMDTAKAMVRP